MSGNIDDLAALIREAEGGREHFLDTQTLGEMAQNDRLAAERAQEQEKELHQLRDRLATSMRSLAEQSVQPLGQP